MGDLRGELEKVVKGTGKATPTVHDARKPRLMSIPVGEIQVAQNIRTQFDPDKLKELSQSIKVSGVLQPLLVRPVGGRFELVAGERRLRAARMAPIEEVPCVVREMSDALALEAQLKENLDREDMNPVDECFAVAKLHMKLGLTQEVTASRLGKTPFYVSQAVAITKLPRQGLDLLRVGVINKTGAYEVTRQPERSTQVAVCAALMPEGGKSKWDGQVVSVTKVRAVIRA